MDRLNPFKEALDARIGKVKSEHLSGASKRLFSDKTLSNDDLKQYAEPVKVDRSRPTVQKHSTFKY